MSFDYAIQDYTPGRTLKKTVYLHIGHHKTGSSALQQFLFDNRQALEKQDVFYPTPRKGVFHKELGGPLRRGKQYYTELFEKIAKSTCQKIILSCEGFFHFRKGHDTIFELLEPYNVRCIIYYRYYPELVESLYHENIKRGHPTSLSAMLNDLKLYDAQRRHETILAWTHRFGHDNICLQPYDLKQLQPHIYGNFLAHIGVAWSEKFTLPNKEQTNHSLDVDVANFLQHVKQQLYKNHKRPIAALTFNYYQRHVTQWAHQHQLYKKRNTTIFTREEHEMLANMSAPFDKVISEKFHPGKTLFTHITASNEYHYPLASKKVYQAIFETLNLEKQKPISLRLILWRHHLRRWLRKALRHMS